MSCGVGCRCSSDPALLWLWCRPVATAPIRPLAWEPPYAGGEALEKAKRPKKKKKICFCCKGNLLSVNYSKVFDYSWSLNNMGFELHCLGSLTCKLWTSFPFFFGCPLGIWKFLSQGVNLSQSCDLLHSCSKAASLTYSARLGIALVAP